MTPEELALPAGRDLDILVAERVLGWVWEPIKTDAYNWRVDGGPRGEMVPWSSTSIAAAWRVVEEMRRRGWGACISSQPESDGWHVTFHRPSEKVDATIAVVGEGACPLPLTICRAALRAVATEGK